MTVRDFCLKKTQVNELCVIRDAGWIIATAWIDSEDLFAMNDKVANCEVKFDEWGRVTIKTEHGDKLEIPCHYIDI